jgi:aryl-alcohol dehydrogenase-like predicted oxidoreductase
MATIRAKDLAALRMWRPAAELTLDGGREMGRHQWSTGTEGAPHDEPAQRGEAARQHAASPQQIVLAWLLARSPQLLPIPGSGNAEHVAQNIAAASIQLDPDAAIYKAA